MKASQTEIVIMLTCCALQSACYSPTGIVISFILAQFQGEVQTNLTAGTRKKCASHRTRRFRMPAACALGIFSGKSFDISGTRNACGRSGFPFSREGFPLSAPSVLQLEVQRRCDTVHRCLKDVCRGHCAALLQLLPCGAAAF